MLLAIDCDVSGGQMHTTKVLVAEDEPGIALGLEDTLRLEGYDVEVVTNGTSASRRAREEEFDLILLDVMLPGKSGFDVCRELRQSGLEAPIIFLTARVQEADRISGLDLGANDYVTKPFSPRELMARVRGLLRFVENNKQGRKRLEDEIDAAAQVQQRLFPSTHPTVRGVDYAGMCLPARGVSGDYYDFFKLPSGRLSLLLADVCGKGMPAALVAASLHAAVRAHAPAADRNCGALITEVNRLLFETTSSERFVTMFYAVYDPSDRTLTWSNAGHCPPLLFQSGNAVTRLESLVMPAGMSPDVPPLQQTTRVAPGDLLLIYSDGIPEASAIHEEEFGERRLIKAVHQNRDLAAPELCRAILDGVKNFGQGGHPADDLTVVAAKFHKD
jgi:sigma-B regulation protein RsbU (phosphoserine phosphatase)